MRYERGRTVVSVDGIGAICIRQGTAGCVILDADKARWLLTTSLPAAIAATPPIDALCSGDPNPKEASNEMAAE